MIRISLETEIAASPEACFDLTRDIGEHAASAAQTGEEIVSAKKSGLLELGDEVSFRGRHLGVKFTLSSRISEFDRPHLFVSEMTRGPFKSLRHEHHFVEDGEGGCRMIDIMDLVAPLGPLGWLAERLFLRAHMTRFLRDRGMYLKRRAEEEG